MPHRPIIIYHFYPIEGYPPIQNLLHYLESRGIHNVICFTTNGQHAFKSNYKNIKLIRLGQTESGSKIKLFLSYVLFFIVASVYSLVKSPKAILYYESISSFPAWVLKSLKKKTKIFIHYHEYTSPEEYTNGPFLPRFFHKLEKSLYKKASWISHTNAERMDFFRNDNNLKEKSIFHVVPNYPSFNLWNTSNKITQTLKAPFKLVYVGYTLEETTMYTNEIFNLVEKNKNLTLDCYLFKEPKITSNNKRISIHKPIAYKEIPGILQKYDIGIIIYKPTTINVKYCAPNKLFEYLAVGLDVWFSDTISGAMPFANQSTYPKVIPVNFESLNKFDWQSAVNHKGLEHKPTNYFCEEVYEKLVDFMISG